MTLRLGVSVGGTTSSASMSDQIKRYRLRELPQPSSAQDALDLRMNGSEHNGKGINAARESLKDKCIRVVVENFAKRPVDEGSCSAEQMKAITSQLPVDLDPAIGALHVFDEGYWKRCCIARLGWAKCDLMAHGQIWKQLFFETLAQEQLESLLPADEEDNETIKNNVISGINNKKDGSSKSVSVSKKKGVIRGSVGKVDSNETKVLASLEASQDYIFSLTIKELNSHPPLNKILNLLPNLSKLDLTYGVRKCGMTTVRSAFGMTAVDATSLTRALSTDGLYCCCPNLTSLTLKGNRIDDSLVKILMQGLLTNDTVTALDMSHNRITDYGVKLISKLLGSESVLTALNLSDNQIRENGGRYIGRGLRRNDSLIELNLRLNLLKDEGVCMLVEGILSNKTAGGSSLTRLNLSGTNAGSKTVVGLGAMFSAGTESSGTLDLGAGGGIGLGSILSSVDLSCNELTVIEVDLLEQALCDNRTLTTLDLRGNLGIGPEADAALENIAKMLKNNELASR